MEVTVRQASPDISLQVLADFGARSVSRCRGADRWKRLSHVARVTEKRGSKAVLSSYHFYEQLGDIGLNANTPTRPMVVAIVQCIYLRNPNTRHRGILGFQTFKMSISSSSPPSPVSLTAISGTSCRNGCSRASAALIRLLGSSSKQR